MNIREKLESSLKVAMRNNDVVEKRTIRMALASIKLEEVNKGRSLNDQDVLSILQKEVKVRHEAIDGAKKANREDLIRENEQEIKVLEQYLPKQFTEEEIQDIAMEVINEVQANNPADMGKVMKVLIPKIQGRAPNDQVSKIVRKILTK